MVVLPGLGHLWPLSPFPAEHLGPNNTHRGAGVAGEGEETFGNPQMTLVPQRALIFLLLLSHPKGSEGRQDATGTCHLREPAVRSTLPQSVHEDERLSPWPRVSV